MDRLMLSPVIVAFGVIGLMIASGAIHVVAVCGAALVVVLGVGTELRK